MRKFSTSLLSCLAGTCLLVSAAGVFESGRTETEGSIRAWRSADGLPADSVTAIIQTRDGFLWVGTSAGLVRFDGVKFTEVKLTESSTNVALRVTALCEDSHGNLWVGSQQDGLFQLQVGTVRHYTTTNGLLDDNVTSLAADALGFVWIGTKCGLNLSTGKEFKAFTVRDGLPDELVTGVHVARSGTVWITTRGGMCRFIDGHIAPYALQTESQGRSPEYLGAYEDRRGNLWAFGDTYLINLAEGKRFNYFRGNETTSVRIWSLCEGRDGRLWIGTSGRGLFCFNDNRFQPVIMGEFRWPNDVRAICEDREGSLWLGTSGGGLMQLLPQPVQVLRADEGLPPGAVTCLAADAAGRIFAGFESGGLFAGEAGRFERFPGNGSVEGQTLIASLCATPDETLWIATLGNGLYGVRNGRKVQLTTLNGLADNSLPAICTTPDGAIWAGTRAGILHRIQQGQITSFARDHGLPGTPITALLPARGGGLWLGTQDGKVLRGESSRFSVVHQVTAASGQSILALQEDSRGRLWIGTAGAGLACWTGQRCSTWTTQNGLPDDNVHGVLEAAEGDLWLVTGRGIFRASREMIQDALANKSAFRSKVMFETKRTSDQVLTFGCPRVLQSVEGKLWFATAEGLIAVDRTGRELVRASLLPVYLENIFVNGRPYRATGSVATAAAKPANAPARLPTDLESLEFQYTALSYVAPEKLNFRHQLEGLDRDWVSDGTERRARYGPLPYGEYRFRVAASQTDGIWTEVTVPFAFTVPTPLWRTAAAVAFYILAAIAAVAGTARVASTRRLRLHLAKLEQQRVLERERMRIAQDMHDDIGSKLTKISFLSERAKLESGGNGAMAGQIDSIATTSRELLQTLDEIVWAVNPRNDSLEHLAAYLSHYAAEYFQNTEVQCEMRLPREIPHHPLSAELRHNLFLAFEEALNNALKHSGASSVSVEMTVNRTDFQIAVTDNGKGFDVAAAAVERPASSGRRGGNGLVNIRQRLAVVGGECVVSSQQRRADVSVGGTASGKPAHPAEGVTGLRGQPGQGTTVSLRIPLGNPAKGKL